MYVLCYHFQALRPPLYTLPPFDFSILGGKRPENSAEKPFRSPQVLPFRSWRSLRFTSHLKTQLLPLLYPAFFQMLCECLCKRLQVCQADPTSGTIRPWRSSRQTFVPKKRSVSFSSCVSVFRQVVGSMYPLNFVKFPPVLQCAALEFEAKFRLHELDPGFAMQSGCACPLES